MAPNNTDFPVLRRLMNVANDMGPHLESHRSALNSHNSRIGSGYGLLSIKRCDAGRRSLKSRYARPKKQMASCLELLRYPQAWPSQHRALAYTWSVPSVRRGTAYECNVHEAGNARLSDKIDGDGPAHGD